MEPAADLRLIGPRIACTILAIAIGFGAAIGITLVIPTRDHYPLRCGFSGRTGHIVEGGSIVMMLAGGIVLSFFVYAIISRAYARRHAKPFPDGRGDIDVRRMRR